MNDKNQTLTNNWGLAAIYQEQKLVFSGTFDLSRIRQERWKKFLQLFKKNKTSYSADKSDTTDIYDLFSPSARQAWSQAFYGAKQRRAAVTLEDIFLALLDEPSVQDLFVRLEEDPVDTKVLLNNYLKLGKPTAFSDELKKIPFEAYALALRLHGRKIGSLMLLGALLKLAPKDSILQAIFTNIGLTLDKLEVLTVWLVHLNFSFPVGSLNDQLLDCCLKAELLEKHFGYFFELPAIEAVANISAKQTNEALQHKTMLRLLVKAGLLAKLKHAAVVPARLVMQASA